MLSLTKDSNTILRVLAATVLPFIAAQGQTVGWVQVGSPSARYDVAAAYDGATQSALLFGGINGSAIYGDTWIWRGTWLQMSPVTSPSPRMGPGIAYDAAAGNIVLFGGSATSPVEPGSSLADTWTWDGVNWTQQYPPASPPARTWSSMVYDPVAKTVMLFGGANLAGGDGGFEDTWIWNGIAKTWTQRHPANHPSPRTVNQLVYDEATRNVVLVGGVAAHLTNLGDTWTWDGINWQEHFPATSPAPRNGPMIAYDPILRAVVLFGGSVGACCSDNLNDTWTWNGSNWTQIYPANPLPAPRNAAGMVYDSNDKSLLMFGGATSGPVLGDTWLFTLAP